MPATRRYETHSYTVNIHEVTPITKWNTRRGYGEVVFRYLNFSSSFRNLIEDSHLNGLYKPECGTYCDLGQTRKQLKWGTLDPIAEYSLEIQLCIRMHAEKVVVRQVKL